MIQAVIFDVDGTLVDSVDLHAWAWQDALAHFGHPVGFDEIRGQIGKGGDQLVPVFLNTQQREDYGAEMESWRGERFKDRYLPMVRPFAAVPELLRRVRDAGMRVAVASSAKAGELATYLEIAGISGLVEVRTSSEDAAKSKPEPDIFAACLRALDLAAEDTVAVGDTPYDAQAADKLSLRSVGVLTGCFPERDLRDAGCVAVYPGPAAMLACFDALPFERRK